MANEDQIEALARRLCEADGNPPDQLATVYALEEKAVPGGIAHFMPKQDYISPCWMFYRHLAIAAIKAAREDNEQLRK